MNIASITFRAAFFAFCKKPYFSTLRKHFRDCITLFSLAVRYFAAAGARSSTAGNHSFKINAHFAISGNPFFNNDSHCLTHDCHSETIVDHFGIHGSHYDAPECHYGGLGWHYDSHVCHYESCVPHYETPECHYGSRECHYDSRVRHYAGREWHFGRREWHFDGREYHFSSRARHYGPVKCHSEEITSQYRAHVQGLKGLKPKYTLQIPCLQVFSFV